MTKRDWNKDWELTMRATPGPWRWEYNKFYGSYSLIAVKDKAVILDDGSYNGDETPYDPLITPNDPNGQFIAEAREALPYWLQRVRELERAIKSFVEVCELAERTGVWVVMTPVMWEAFEKLKGVVKRDAD